MEAFRRFLRANALSVIRDSKARRPLAMLVSGLFLWSDGTMFTRIAYLMIEILVFGAGMTLLCTIAAYLSHRRSKP